MKIAGVRAGKITDIKLDQRTKQRARRVPDRPRRLRRRCAPTCTASRARSRSSASTSSTASPARAARAPEAGLDDPGRRTPRRRSRPTSSTTSCAALARAPQHHPQRARRRRRRQRPEPQRRDPPRVARPARDRPGPGDPRRAEPGPRRPDHERRQGHRRPRRQPQGRRRAGSSRRATPRGARPSAAPTSPPACSGCRASSSSSGRRWSSSATPPTSRRRRCATSTRRRRSSSASSTDLGAVRARPRGPRSARSARRRDRPPGGEGRGQPTVAELDAFAQGTPELGKNLAIVLEHLDDRNHAVEKDPRSPGGKGYTGLEALLEYVFDQAQSINIFDRNGHILKVAAFDSECAEYADVKCAQGGPEAPTTVRRRPRPEPAGHHDAGHESTPDRLAGGNRRPTGAEPRPRRRARPDGRRANEPARAAAGAGGGAEAERASRRAGPTPRDAKRPDRRRTPVPHAPRVPPTSPDVAGAAVDAGVAPDRAVLPGGARPRRSPAAASPAPRLPARP